MNASLHRLPRGPAQLALVAVGIAAAVLLSSCAAPPPRQTSTRKPATQKVESHEPHQAPARVCETKPAAPSIQESPTALPPHTTPKPRRRYAGFPGEIAHAGSGTRVALTFDAGASSVPTPSILKTLRDNGLHVTFFLTGKWCEKNPELVRQIAAEGHEIGNHTYSHPDLRKCTDEEIIDQLARTEELVRSLTGRSTKPYFRPPFGGRDRRVLQVAGEQGYTSVYWSLDCLDAYKKGITADQITQRVLDRIQGGDIVLMHCGSAATAQALPELIAKLKERGFEIVKVSELASN